MQNSEFFFSFNLIASALLEEQIVRRRVFPGEGKDEDQEHEGHNNDLILEQQIQKSVIGEMRWFCPPPKADWRSTLRDI